jgi:hypothetical protein
VFCSECGTPKVDGVKFCLKCGAGLILKRSNRPASPKETSYREMRPRIARVARNSPAGILGLVPGDHVLTLNSTAVGSAPEWSELLFRSLDSKVVRMEFFRSQTGEVAEVEIPPVPPGFVLEETLRCLRHAYMENPQSVSQAIAYMKKLYVEGDFATCRRVATEFDTQVDKGTPACLFIGASMIGEAVQSKKRELLSEGIRIVQQYQQDFMDAWTTDYSAVSFYSAGQYMEASGRRNEAQDAYQRSIELDYDFVKPCEALSRLTGRPTGSFQPSKASPWVGQRLPADYHLSWAQVNGMNTTGRRQDLRECLTRMGPKGYVGMILLGPYRDCGPGDAETKKLANLAKNFPTALPVVHLLTSSMETGRPEWQAGERWLLRSGLNFHVLYDAFLREQGRDDRRVRT